MSIISFSLSFMKSHLYWFLILWICFSPLPAAATENNVKKLSAFIESFEKWAYFYKKTRFRPQSNMLIQIPPWKYYTQQRFNLKLSAKQQSDIKVAAERGHCKKVAKWETIGFLELYPHLKPAFKRTDVQDYFNDQILPVASWPMVFCLSFRYLNNLPKTNAPSLNTKWIFETKKHANQHKAYLALQNLTSLGKCGNYLPATVALLKLTVKKKRIIMSRWEQERLLRQLKGTALETAFGPQPKNTTDGKITNPLSLPYSCQKTGRNGQMFQLLN